ncbi:RagB/SusD family nutrient uptake outer membrane protein [Rubrivirga litoralis]|uniref:RagB/SusD family nutrient uptake outer membrane protein n=1 Tax=Rubrivirga litoralis TaxID=3075598 RepID=A0ABU3BNK0_9BACT|nr:RagB/SusD family nutrient uptake outer membrane protein [Rubrivirga sp. F394]MDT0630864.1 RagB/SusD family nutrient uptake outer membrane protein [Rubrivirga sp. F394]
MLPARFRPALLLSLALVLGACDGLLDLEPQQSISNERALATPQNVESAIVGAYDRMSDGDLYGGQLMMGPDLLAASNAEVVWTGTFAQPREFWNKSLLVNNSFVEDTWEDAYDVINVANNVLSALDVFGDEGARDRAEGHARFLRGLMYFELVRLWGPAWTGGDPGSDLGVPLVLEPTRTVTEADDRARSTVGEVYAQIITDLEAARDRLPQNDGDLADTYAASAVLSRVYLSQGDYPAAAAEASRVIEGSGHALAPTFGDAFNQAAGSSEYVFGIPITEQDGVNELNTFYGARENSGRGDIQLTADYAGLFAADDARAFFYVDDRRRRRTAKWQGTTAEGVDIPVIRLAEMLLTRAEANLRAGTTVGAAPLADVNAVRERAGLDALDAVSVDDVLRERRLELDFEGELLHDLKRTQRAIPTIDGELPATAPRFLYPIPQREIDANPNLEQNAYY